jgi:hypothetical protein
MPERHVIRSHTYTAYSATAEWERRGDEHAKPDHQKSEREEAMKTRNPITKRVGEKRRSTREIGPPKETSTVNRTTRKDEHCTRRARDEAADCWSGKYCRRSSSHRQSL